MSDLFPDRPPRPPSEGEEARRYVRVPQRAWDRIRAIALMRGCTVNEVAAIAFQFLDADRVPNRLRGGEPLRRDREGWKPLPGTDNPTDEELSPPAERRT